MPAGVTSNVTGGSLLVPADEQRVVLARPRKGNLRASASCALTWGGVKLLGGLEQRANVRLVEPEVSTDALDVLVRYLRLVAVGRGNRVVPRRWSKELLV